jgi:hypothetical protein
MYTIFESGKIEIVEIKITQSPSGATKERAMRIIKYIKKRFNDWTYRRGYEVTAGIVLYNSHEDGADQIEKILNETDSFGQFHKGMCAALFAFKGKCRIY